MSLEQLIDLVLECCWHPRYATRLSPEVVKFHEETKAVLHCDLSCMGSVSLWGEGRGGFVNLGGSDFTACHLRVWGFGYYPIHREGTSSFIFNLI